MNIEYDMKGRKYQLKEIEGGGISAIFLFRRAESGETLGASRSHPTLSPLTFIFVA